MVVWTSRLSRSLALGHSASRLHSSSTHSVHSNENDPVDSGQSTWQNHTSFGQSEGIREPDWRRTSPRAYCRSNSSVLFKWRQRSLAVSLVLLAVVMLRLCMTHRIEAKWLCTFGIHKYPHLRAAMSTGYQSNRVDIMWQTWSTGGEGEFALAKTWIVFKRNWQLLDAPGHPAKCRKPFRRRRQWSEGAGRR